MNGILNIDKPSGISSFGVVAVIKRLTGERRAGHAGTLDPLATGVLPVCLNQATRVTEYLLESRKAYRAEVELGIATETGDAAGRIRSLRDASAITRDILLSALGNFRGQIHQTPPMYSAVKSGGKPLYKLARAGISVERRSRLAEIYELELVAWNPPVATLEVTCSKGTYIRTLAEDIGEMLGCGAHLKNLSRLRYGPFDIRDAVPLAHVEEVCGRGELAKLLYPVDSVLLHWPAVVLAAEAADDIRHGRPIPAGAGGASFEPLSLHDSGNRCRAYNLDGCFLGVLRFNPERGELQPEKVFV